jgi:thiamine-monophosphate kinase
MKLREAGERRLLEWIRGFFPGAPWVRVGIGDDGAVLREGRGELVVCSDLLVRSLDLPEGVDPFYLGWRAVISNLSDLAAMGARPLALLFSLGLPPELEVKEFRRILLGIRRASSLYGVPVVGGDLSGCGEVVVNGMGVGRTERILTRKGARPGDLVALTGQVGGAAGGLEVIRRGLKGHRGLVRRFLLPKARVREGQILAREGATSALDLSDGLSSGAWRLAEESGVRIVLDPSRLPLPPGLLGLSGEGPSPLELALHGGEDFELLFTLPPPRWGRVRRSLERVGCGVTPVGRVERGKGVLLEGGKRLPERGYEHYRNP